MFMGSLGQLNLDNLISYFKLNKIVELELMNTEIEKLYVYKYIFIIIHLSTLMTDLSKQLKEEKIKIVH